MRSSPRWVWAPAQTLGKRQVPDTCLGPWPTPATHSPDRTPEILREWTSGKKGLSQQDYRHTHSSLGSPQAILFSPAPCEPALPACI